jgi:aryl-alcohol dehydrogenase-like predicted oxidoreductase
MTVVAPVPARPLGATGLVASAQGLGCMGMSQAYGRADDDESIATIHRALDLGVTLLDTANAYGRGRNEELVGRAIAGRRADAVIATKMGIRTDEGAPAFSLDGSPDAVRRCCDESLARLGVEHIDLYYLHRVDPNVPIEDSVGALAELVAAGKVGHLGLSEAGPDTLRRAAAVHPIAALQTEWSLWTRDLEAEIVPTCRELGIGLVPYSPLGRGFLTGQITSPDDFDEGDLRRNLPRFQGARFQRNLDLVAQVRTLADRHGATPGQVALAWLHAKGDDVFPIPGTKRRTHLEDNVGGLSIDLAPDDLARLDAMGDAVDGDSHFYLEWAER